MPRVFAACDIGSNTVHLLIGETDGVSVRRLMNETDWLSLGETVSRNGYIPESEVNRLLRTLRNYKSMAQGRRAEGMYVFATEAMRLASNHDEVVDLIEKKLRLRVEIISGRREAELSLRGSLLDSAGEYPLALFEVGGGSAQVARYDGDSITEEVSLPIGTGRLLVSSGDGDPPSADSVRCMECTIRDSLSLCSSFGSVVRAVASGGVARGFTRALHPDNDSLIYLEELDYVIWVARRLNSGRIAARFGVRPQRARALLPGALVFRSLLDYFGLAHMQVSEYGVREGAILEMFDGVSSLCRL